jgi:serine/threonine-protein kinase
MATSRGTRQFKAPEALHDVSSDSLAGDVWAVGMTLHLLLTDRLPFDVPDDYVLGSTSKAFQEALVPPSQVNPICDSSLDRIVARSLAIDPQNRYASAVELLADLDAWAPKLQAESRERGQDPWSTSKEVLGRASTPLPEEARRIASRAIELAQNPATLNEAADLMEEAFSKLPELRNEYRGRVTLWRRGISM